MADPIEIFLSEIELTATRVVALPRIILVLGGPLSIKPEDLYKSNRNVFVTKMLQAGDDLATLLCMPENYYEWNQFNGYPNLVDFEKDAGSLTRAILLFSESAGAIAELASFAGDAVLCERLVVVLKRRHFDEVSYITLGPVRQALMQSETAVCVIEADSPQFFESEVEYVAAAVRQKFESEPKKTRFDGRKRRDRFLFIADLVELFSALTFAEISMALERAQLDFEKTSLERELKLLEMFGLVVSSVSDRRFYVPPKQEKRQSYLDYQAKAGVANFVRARAKAKHFASMLHDRPRQRAYQVVHGGVT